jgi:phage tail-like protein
MTSSADPYSAFNFLMEWSHPEASNISKAGFSEVTGLGKEVTVVEYRTGNGIENGARQVASTSKSSNITLKRGMMEAKDLFEWVKSARDGSVLRFRTVTITLRDDDGADVMRWRLSKAQPLKWTGPSLDSKDPEIAIEELILVFEVMAIQAVD